MGVPMTTQQFKDAYEPVLIADYALGESRLKPQWSKFTKVVPSRKLAIENKVQMYGLGIAQLKPEGNSITYEGGGESYKSTFIKQTFAIGFAVTEEAMEFDEHMDIMAEYGPELPVAQNEAQEIVCANVLNNAFNNTAQPGPDGVAFVASNHPIQSGTYSNILATPADLSEASLEQLRIQVMNAVDMNGRPIDLQVDRLLIGNDNVFVADRILKSMLRSGTGNNDMNALRDGGYIPEVQLVRRLTNQKAYFLQTNQKNGIELMYGWRAKVKYEGDFDTGNMRGKSTLNYAVSWTNPRALYASQGT